MTAVNVDIMCWGNLHNMPAALRFTDMYVLVRTAAREN